ncbi:MAG: hypothetical protein Mars2KO_01430 [Maribacter sp.]
MHTNKSPYLHFSKYVLRTPVLSFDFYQKLTADDLILSDTLKEAYSYPVVKEACFLASPTLYFEMEKWLKGELDSKKERKIQFSLLKYLTRMSTRCTPFGLFAGCSLGDLDDVTSIKNTEPDLNTRHTRLDMNYLVALSQDLSKEKEIRQQLLYYPNSSIYTTWNQLRYIEYYYLESKRNHHIVEVDNSTYLQKLLSESATGAFLHELIPLLEEDGIPKNDAENFIDELLESQLLVSELEPSVSGPEFMPQIFEVLERIKGSEKEIEFLKKIEKTLDTIDKQIGNTPTAYLQLTEHLKTYPTSPEIKYLFQTDMDLQPKENKLSTEIVKSIQKGIVLLNKITPPVTEDNLSKFKEAFQERYEEREMPLSKVLDVETGIGYLQNNGSGDVNPLVDDIVLPFKNDPYNKTNINQNEIHRILEEKLILSDQNGGQKIVLTDKDFEDFPLNWDDLPDTLSAMIQIILEKGDQKIQFSGAGGSSAANLLGRFCHGDTELNAFTQSIADLEAEMNSDKILAEIVHLPEARVGNILMRPSFRDYEIPYLAKSSLDLEHQIPLEDLFISIRNNSILLRSKKLNKEIVPHLTNAHNFSANALPIYQFLCDMQTQNQKKSIFFSFGFLGNNRSFIPRVEYRNLILHVAKWKIKKIDIKDLFEESENTRNFAIEVNKWRSKLKLPKYALLTDGDNELLINFNNLTSVRMLLDTVKNRSEFLLSEFLFSKEGIVKSENSYHTHQIVISFFNNQKMQSLNGAHG